jgi:hypothetical protein
MCGLLGALLGHNHPCILAYHGFLHQYDHLQNRLEGELEFGYGRWISPSLVTFHVQLIWRNWLLLQLDIEETAHLSAQYFCTGPNVLQSQNNLSCFPTITNVPALLALWSAHRGMEGGGKNNNAQCGGCNATPAPPRRDLGCQVRNP